ncbi:MAG: cob(I)yrinic acid a,c-diamide adenosyltransferase [Verrucomicrobia bacterium]|nr:MAG: cob(I)yrinic acid a,c-diamide adenosyltransferase [Verrucomicrobiota bacterium]
MSIITGRGDSGETDLLFGKRIAKTSLRIAALGGVDEVNAALGLARAGGGQAEVITLIDAIQERLIGLMGQLACLPEDMGRYKYASITHEDVAWVEAEARRFETRGVRFTGWARPGAEGSLARAGLDFARAMARRAERSVWDLHESGEAVPAAVRLFFNRLSDLLWILARVEEPETQDGQTQDASEEAGAADSH